MKILYAIQGTGNGHVARATEIVPILNKLAETDVLVSGIQSDLELPFEVKYRFYGLSFIFGTNGGVDVFKTASKLKLLRLVRDITALPVHKYDLVINDFEPVSAWACKFRKKKCIGLSHQNAVLHDLVPKREKKYFWGEQILKRYAPCDFKYGFHFDPLSEEIFPPVIRSTLRTRDVQNKGHFTVYLPAYSDTQIIETLAHIVNTEWHVFSKHSKKEYKPEFD